MINFESNKLDQTVGLCMNCNKEGFVDRVRHQVPFQSLEIIISYYNCPHCYKIDYNIKFPNSDNFKGLKYELKVVE